jgi:hypothetical protein
VQAGKKAFIVNRVGDFGFGLGVMWLWISVGTLDYGAAFAAVDGIAPSTATGIALLLFMGACGKSAQLPLHTWLPDAMEGPTPVSALIHAATMVTAGVYMVARSHVIFERSPIALEVVAWVGVATALFAATIGLVQTDIKRVLAYSTVSQLGYMFAAVGVGAYAAGIFHLVTHAFFKALLFLGAGSVIHGLGGEQDLRKMGGLSSRMVATTITTTIGGLALAGLPGLSGFFSKDEILAAAYGSGHKGLWALLLLGAFMTSFYTSRMLFLAFYSGPRMSKEAAHHVHESPGVMTWPLWVLALLTVITGIAFGIPADHGTRLRALPGAGVPRARERAQRRRGADAAALGGHGVRRRRRGGLVHVHGDGRARRRDRQAADAGPRAPAQRLLRRRVVRSRDRATAPGALAVPGRRLRRGPDRRNRQRGRPAPSSRAGRACGESRRATPSTTRSRCSPAPSPSSSFSSPDDPQSNQFRTYGAGSHLRQATLGATRPPGTR